MTSSSGVQLTPGQRCLLDLLQRKLLSTLQCYARLSLERQKAGQSEEIDNELLRLKEKIRRISARQKRFTLEIINGNGNNTIPKESFFEALGLVTREAFSKLNSKTNERRRRTTANPRFSHEAIQAKRALEPLQKRLESRVKDNKRESSSRKPTQRHQQSNNSIDSTNNNNNNTNNNNNNNNNNGGTSGGSKNNVNLSTKAINNNQQAALNNNNNNSNNNARTGSRSSSNRNNQNLMIHNERQELLVQFGQLQRQINSKVNQIKYKQKSNKKLEEYNELIRKNGLEIISAINEINPNLTKGASIEEENQPSLEQTNKPPNSQTDQSTQPTEPLDIWIDMKCDESLDGLD